MDALGRAKGGGVEKRQGSEKVTRWCNVNVQELEFQDDQRTASIAFLENANGCWLECLNLRV